MGCDRKWPEVWVRFQRTAAFADPEVAASVVPLLEEEERARWERIRAWEARCDYLGAHVLRRRMLAAFSGTDPASFRFRESALGRPRIVAPTAGRRFRSSLSHADGVAVCAVTVGLDVGVDVESRRSLSGDLLAVAGMICSRAEVAALEVLPAPARPDRILELWTAREALGQALGEGSPQDRSTWRTACWPVTRDHVASVAVCVAADVPVALRVEEEPSPYGAQEPARSLNSPPH